MTKRLMLFAIEPYTSKQSGEPMFRYMFIGNDGKAYSGINSEKLYSNEVHDAEEYDDTHAREWELRRGVFGGKLTYSVVIA